MAASPYTVVRQRREERQVRLVALGYLDYPAYLRSPHWRRIRGAYRQSTEPQDCICGETEALELHHMTYDRIGAEDLGDLTPLCRSCHRMIHELERRGEIGLDFRGFVSEKRAERYAVSQRPLNERRDAESQIRREEAARANLRSLIGRLREAAIQTIKDGGDPTDAIEEAIARLQ